MLADCVVRYDKTVYQVEVLIFFPIGINATSNVENVQAYTKCTGTSGLRFLRFKVNSLLTENNSVDHPPWMNSFLVS